MKKTLLLFLALSLILSSLSLPVFARDLKENEHGIAYIPGDIIVMVNRYVDPDDYPDSTPRDFFGVDIISIEPLFDATTEEEIQSWIDLVGYNLMYLITLQTPCDEMAAIDILLSNEVVLYAEENAVWSENGRLIGHTEHIFESPLQDDFKCSVISSKERLDAFLGIYIPNDENDGFWGFVNELPADYFDEKALVIASVDFGRRVAPVVPEVQSIIVKGSNIEFTATYSVSSEASSSSYLLVAEVNKIRVADCKGTLEVSFYDDSTKKVTDTFSDSIPHSILSTMFGDVDSSLSFDADDYIFLKRLVFGTVNESECKGDLFSRGDINGDGVLDADDYILLKRAYFGTYSLD